MQHTFLFEPGVWRASGTFWSADGLAMPVEGRTEISHRPECWLLAGTMKVLCSPPAEFVNVYSIEPPRAPAGTSLKWSSDNPALGRLHGTFCTAGPSIMSLYRSERGGYQGAEHLAYVAADRYEACGVLLMEDRYVSAWRVALTRERPGR